MDTCPYYCEELRGTGTKREIIPCCRHKHSPAPCSMPSLLTQRPHELKCGGRLSKCQIPAHEQLDLS